MFDRRVVNSLHGLFARTGNSISLSPHGEIFLRYVNQALTSLDAGKAELLNLSEKDTKHPSFAEYKKERGL